MHSRSTAKTSFFANLDAAPCVRMIQCCSLLPHPFHVMCFCHHAGEDKKQFEPCHLKAVTMKNELDKESSEKAKITHSDEYQRNLKDCKVFTAPSVTAGCRFGFCRQCCKDLCRRESHAPNMRSWKSSWRSRPRTVHSTRQRNRRTARFVHVHVL